MHKPYIEYITHDQVDTMANEMKQKECKLLCINGYMDTDGTLKVVYNFEISKDKVKTYICKVNNEIMSLKDYFGEYALKYEQEIMEFLFIKFIGIEEKSMFLSKDSNIRGQIFTVPILEE